MGQQGENTCLYTITTVTCQNMYTDNKSSLAILYKQSGSYSRDEETTQVGELWHSLQQRPGVPASQDVRVPDGGSRVYPTPN